MVRPRSLAAAGVALLVLLLARGVSATPAATAASGRAVGGRGMPAACGSTPPSRPAVGGFEAPLRVTRDGSGAIVSVGVCVTLKLARISGWSLGDVPLQPQTVALHGLAAITLGGRLQAGIIGSDVLGRFGAVRVDYRDRTLVLAQREGPAFSGEHVVSSSRSATPRFLTAGSEATIDATVVTDSGATEVFAPVRLGGGSPQPFLVDTGSRLSLIRADLAAHLHLASAHRRSVVRGVACSTSLAEVRSGRWAIGSAEQAARRAAGRHRDRRRPRL